MTQKKLKQQNFEIINNTSTTTTLINGVKLALRDSKNYTAKGS